MGKAGRGRRDDDEGPAEDAAGREVVGRSFGEGSGLVMVVAMALVELPLPARHFVLLCVFAVC